MSNQTLSPALLGWLFGAYALLYADEAPGEITLFEREWLSVEGTLEAALGAFPTINTAFGRGRVDVRSGENTGDAKWGEAYLKSGLDLRLGPGRFGTLKAGVTGLATVTVGDGDAAGFTRGGDGGVDRERLYLGWRSGKLGADAIGEDAIEVSFGQQEFEIGTGFLIRDGNLDFFRDGAYWLLPRYAFKTAALLRLNTRPVRGDAFYLKTDRDLNDTEVAGVNLEYRSAGLGGFGVMYFEVLDATPTLALPLPSNGMQVINLRALELSLPRLPDLSLSGEYVLETGEGAGVRYDASAWYGEAHYRFDEATWTPGITYRYALFSGGDFGEGAIRGDYEPFFYGYNGFGRWNQGEIAGAYLLFNSNQVNHLLHLTASPSERLDIGALYWRFCLDKNQYFGTPVREKHFADEVDLYGVWILSPNASVTLAYSLAVPGAREAFGSSEVFHQLQLITRLLF